MTSFDRANALGLDAYDVALPLDWFKRACDVAGFNVSGHVVWCYDSSDDGACATFGGYPVALTLEGRCLLGAMAS